MSVKARIKIRIVFLCIAPFLAGYALINKPIEFVDEFINTALFPPYSGPKAKITVADFEVMTAKATSDISSDLREILIAGLLKSGRFDLASIPKDGVVKSSGLIIATRLLDFEPYGQVS